MTTTYTSTALEASGTVYEVLEGSLVLPRMGVWRAHLTIGELDPVSGPARLLVARDDDAGAPVEFVGTVRRSTPYETAQRVEVVGGSGLSAEVEPREYLSDPDRPTADLFLAELVEDAGEQADAAALAALAGVSFARWARHGGRAIDALLAFAERFGLGARVLGSGAVWLGVEAWPAVGDEVIGYQVADRGDDAAIESYPDAATARPGTALADGRMLTEIMFTFGSGGLSLEARYERA